MVADVMRLPLPEPDDSHPLDWYPGDEPESRSVEEANRWIEETLTRSGDVVKLQGGAGSVCTAPTPNTTTPAREIVMPVQRTTRRRQFAVHPRVYFMFCEMCDVVKVGFSRDFRVRRRELQRGTGHPLRVLGIHPGNRQIEARVHALFAAERVEGEWFRPSRALLRYIEEHTTLPSGSPRPGRSLP